MRMIVIMLAVLSTLAFARFEKLVGFGQNWQVSMGATCLTFCIFSLMAGLLFYKKSDAIFTVGTVSAVFWALVHPAMLWDPQSALLVAGFITGLIVAWRTDHTSSWLSWSRIGRFFIAGIACIVAGLGPLCAYAQFEDFSLEYVLCFEVVMLATLIWASFRFFKTDTFFVELVSSEQTAGTR